MEMKRTLILKNGSEHEITDENGKYYVCGDTQFRKGNQMIDHVQVDETPICYKPQKEEPLPFEEEVKEEKPKAKKKAKKTEE